jgi:hypothetical protein
MKTAIVCTTIGDGSFLKSYVPVLAGRDVTMIVVPDKKSPASLYEAAGQARHEGMQAWCPPPEVQGTFLDRIGTPTGFFPWNTDHRRNVGYLMAYESGADVIISIDDDNLPRHGTWLDEHVTALTCTGNAQVVTAGRGFFNPCDVLDCGEITPAARGLPYRSRGAPAYTPCVMQGAAISEGLWLGDPDVDAVSRIALHPEATWLKAASIVLGPRTWAPVNSQNTAIRREVLPAYYFFRSPRFGDIYQGYLAQACAKAAGHDVRFGTPLVRHERNDHDLLNDLDKELPDMLRLDDWLGWLTEQRPAGGYAESYAMLADGLQREGYGLMADEMRTWLTLCRRIDGAES